MLVRRTDELDRVHLAHCAAGAVTPGHPRGGDLSKTSIGLLERCLDVVDLLPERNELGIPAHGHSMPAQSVAHQPFVVVLTEDQKKRKGTQVTPDIADRNS